MIVVLSFLRITVSLFRLNSAEKGCRKFHSFFDLLRVCLHVTGAKHLIKMIVRARARIIWIIGEECLNGQLDLVLLPGPDTHLLKEDLLVEL
jgi:hypothetical protein